MSTNLSSRHSACAIAALLLASPLLAGNHAITSHTVDGGGATSSGGQYAVTGTIGQPDAHGASAGGAYSIRGGFFSQYMALQRTGAPLLIIRQQGTGVQVAWAANVSGWRLQRNAVDLLTPPNWQDVSGTPAVTGSEQFHQFPAVGGRVFFRLRKL